MLNEQQLEDLCLGWFQEAGWRCAHGPDIAPDGSAPGRTKHQKVTLNKSGYLQTPQVQVANQVLQCLATTKK